MSLFVKFIERLRSRATEPAIEGEGYQYTYGQLLEEMERWAVRIDESGLLPGCVVGLRAEHSLSATAALLALFERRAIAALIPRDRDPENYLSDARASALFDIEISGRYHRHMFPNAADHPLLEGLRRTNESGIVMFTSGSAGRPKAILQSLDRFLRKFKKPGRHLRTLAFLLFDHVAGLDTIFYTLSNGGPLILTQRRDPRTILRAIESHRVEVLPASPSFLRLLCASGDAQKYDLSSVKVVTYGSEPMDHKTLVRVNALFPRAQIIQKYGTTEIGSPRSASKDNTSLWMTIKNEGVETKVVDGVLWIRSEGAMLGYLNAPTPIDGNGWYCTGDLVEEDGEWIRFCGRISDTINVGGEKVSPAEIERLILELENVKDVVVRGESHELMGQIVTAKVSLRASGRDLGQEINRIRSHCRALLPPHKVPVKIYVATGEFVNDRQKVQRHDATEK